MQSKANPNSNQSKFKLKLAGVTCALLLGTSSAFAVPAVQGSVCNLLSPGTPNSTAFLFPENDGGAVFSAQNGTNSIAGLLMTGNFTASVSPGVDIRRCFYSVLPSSIDTSCDMTVSEVDNATNYIALFHDNGAPSPRYCLYSYDVDVTNATPALRRTNAAVVTTLASSTAVPIFTPLGLLAMMSGLLWFGKRRRKFK